MSNEIESKIAKWLENLGISDLDRSLIRMAFTHPSYKGLDPTADDYEKLEFLGDSVLNLVAAEELAKDFTESEGVMTEKRKAIVNNEFLAQVFDHLKMEKFLRAAINYHPSIKKAHQRVIVRIKITPNVE